MGLIAIRLVGSRISGVGGIKILLFLKTMETMFGCKSDFAMMRFPGDDDGRSNQINALSPKGLHNV